MFIMNATLVGSTGTPSFHTIWPSIFPCGTQNMHFLRFKDIFNSLHLSNISHNSVTCSFIRMYTIQSSM
jgi:hypothetical protein